LKRNDSSGNVDLDPDTCAERRILQFSVLLFADLSSGHAREISRFAAAHRLGLLIRRIDAVKSGLQLGKVPGKIVRRVEREAGLQVSCAEQWTEYPYIEDAEAQVEVVLRRRAMLSSVRVVLERTLRRPHLEG